MLEQKISFLMIAYMRMELNNGSIIFYLKYFTWMQFILALINHLALTAACDSSVKH